MVYTFKKNGVRAAVHTQSGKVHLLDSLTFDMLAQITPPLSPELPMGVRYFFAKYDSGDLKKAYTDIQEIYRDADATVPETWIGAVLTPATLGTRYTHLLQECAAHCGDDFTLLLCAADEETVQTAIAAARELLPQAKLILRAPLSLCHCHGADGYQALVGDITAFVGAELPENTTILTTFGKDTDLAREVTRLLDAGYAVCAVPDAEMPPDAAVQAYDALSRVLLRRKRTGRDDHFLPFTLAKSMGCWLENDTLATADLTTMPGAFWQYGTQMLLSGCISSVAVLRCLAECAIVLEA